MTVVVGLGRIGQQRRPAWGLIANTPQIKLKDGFLAPVDDFSMVVFSAQVRDRDNLPSLSKSFVCTLGDAVRLRSLLVVPSLRFDFMSLFSA